MLKMSCEPGQLCSLSLPVSLSLSLAESPTLLHTRTLCHTFLVGQHVMLKGKGEGGVVKLGKKTDKFQDSGQQVTSALL